MFSDKAQKFLSLVLVLLLPTQLALHFWPDFSLIYGIRIDYLSPTIYLTDLLILGILLLWIPTRIRLVKEFRHIITIFLILATLNTLFSINVLVAFIKWIKIAELILIGLYFWEKKKSISEKLIYKTFFVSLIVVSIIGIVQFFTSRSWGSEFYLIGVRQFDLSTPGIALRNIFGSPHLRAYSSFSHPNSLAGFLGVGMLILYLKRNYFSLKYHIFGLLIVLACFFLTFSLSAYVAILIAFLIRKYWNYKKSVTYAGLLLSLIIAVLNIEVFGGFSSFSERIELTKSAVYTIIAHPIFGVGLNNYILSLPYNSLLQPVHNVLWLIFSETGIVGLIVVLLFYQKFTNKKYFMIFVFIFVTSLFDHYWVTLQQNLLLLTFITAMLN